MNYDVVFVEAITNKSTTWHFKKYKEAKKFLESICSLKSKGYYVLCFTIE